MVQLAESRAVGIEDLRSLVAPIELATTVPAEIRAEFDIARNAFIYSWFVYEFACLAEKQAFAVVELALRRRLHPEEAPNTTRSAGLKRLLKEAQKRGVLRASNFEIPAMNGGDGTLSVLDMLPDFRNHAFHGNIHLLPQETPTVLGLCAEVINALFGSEAHP